MREINKIAEGLFEKIRDRFEDVSLGDDNAKACSDPEKARFFNFDYVVDGDNHGNITMSLIDETSLKIYFSKNISDDLDDDQKKEWYSFLRELREFARRNLLSFEPRDITRSTLKHRDIQQQSKADSTYAKDEVVAESKLYGTSKSSYQKFGPARIIVRHDKHVTDESRGERSRHINSIYVENHEGERFKMPFKSLTASRAMARHISAGGTPHDDLGHHICEMAQECSKLKPFLNNVRHRMFEDEETKTMVEAAFDYHKLLKNTLQRMGGKKGYTTCKEQFVATSTSYVPEDDVDLNEIKERFIKRVFNDKMEDALPLVHKAYTMKKENKFTEQFETWATAISEGTWALPETDEDKQKLIDILSQELPVGVDAQNATNVLYNIFGDDRLFDALEELSTVDPEADARDTIMDHLMDKNPTMYQAILDAIGDEDTPEPAEDNQEVDESYTPPPVAINGKQVDLRSIELDGVESWDRPDYADAYANYAEFTDGTALTDDELEELTKNHGDVINMRAHDMLEGNTYGSGDGGMDGQVNEEETDQDDQLANIESIQSAIIRRILNSINDHSELLKKAGPEGIMNAASDVASFHAPMEEIGSSDISIMVREVYREVGVDYPEDEVAEAKDKVTYDPKTGKLTGWEHEGDWKKQTKKKDPVGKIHHMSDVARRRTEKMAKDETLEEAFERLVNEGAINVGDMIRDKTQPTIQGKVVGDIDENYIIQVEDDQYHIKKLNAEVVEKGLLEADSRFMSYLEPLVGQEVYIPGEGTTGTVVGPSPNPKLPTGIQVKLSNGQLVTTGPGLFKSTKPGLVQQAIDKLNSLTGKIDPVPSVAKPYGTVAGPMDNLHKQDWSNVKEDILKLAGVK
jgi:hypothetical protein